MPGTAQQPGDTSYNAPGVGPSGTKQRPGSSVREAMRGRLQRALLWAGPYAVIAANVVLVIACFTLLRIVMFAVYVGFREASLSEMLGAFLIGLRFDILVALGYVLLQVCHITFVSSRQITSRGSRWLLDAAWLIGYVLLVAACAAEYIFFDEFESRFNYIAFEYFVYPTEVCCNIWQSYPVVSILTGVLAACGSVWLILRRPFLKQVAIPVPWRRRYGFLGAVLVAIAVLAATTRPGTTSISSNRLVNECAGNGFYTFVYHAWTCRLDYEQNYITVSESEVHRRVRDQMPKETSEFVSGSNNPVDRVVTAGRPRRDCNVVLVLEESFGSDFVGVLGDDRGLTPCFDELSREGVLFDQFYATGNRTARALEAVLTSMPPIPTESILKRDRSDRVFTLAHALAERGYERLFVTGGRGVFDGVRSFMRHNGFNHFVEQSHVKDPVFTNAWGVSDEDMFRQSLVELDKLHETGRPFFATLLTVSNHLPFTFPKGRIADEQGSRKSAVKYADWALGNFFKEAQSHEFYKNTLFVVMGDHGARVYGRQLFPVKSYRVPVLMVLPEGERRGTRVNTLACSMDIAPTIMGQLGGAYRSVFYGVDAFEVHPTQGRALMQHNHNIALLDAQQRMLVLGIGKSASAFALEPATFQFRQERTPDPEMVQNAAALYQTACRLYYAERWFPDSASQARLE